MDEDGYGIEISVRGSIDNGYRLKASFHNLGMYVDGFRALKVPTSKNSSGWWIQPPAKRIGKAYKVCPEFDKKHPFWLEIEERCIEVANEQAVLDTGDLAEAGFEQSLDEAFKQFENT